MFYIATDAEQLYRKIVDFAESVERSKLAQRIPKRLGVEML
jgi:hypothetical protein